MSGLPSIIGVRTYLRGLWILTRLRRGMRGLTGQLRGHGSEPSVPTSREHFPDASENGSSAVGLHD